MGKRASLNTAFLVAGNHPALIEQIDHVAVLLRHLPTMCIISNADRSV